MFKRTVLFILLWCAWGFALGTLLLLGPVRWLITYARANHYTDGTERMVVMICIAALVLVSLLIAWWSSRFIGSAINSRSKLLLLGVPILGACLAVWAFMNPKLMTAGSKEEVLGKNFTIGAYPEPEKLQALKDEGYTAVISLLHPALIPFEPQLIAAEKKNAAAVGIELIEMPMVPWIVDNVEAIDSLKRLVANGKGKYYIHCYLGKDRVNVARRIIEEAHEKVVLENNQFHYRTLDSVKKFERGPVMELNEGVYFTPMPTKEEYFGYILTGKLKQVVSLIDTTNTEAKILMQQEEKTVSALHIKFKVYQVNETTGAGAFLKMSNEIKQLPTPMVIHPFFSDSKEAQLFLEAYHKK